MSESHRIEGPTLESGDWSVETFRIYQNDDGGERIGRLVAKVYAFAGVEVARAEADRICNALKD
jgi:hypothetical protein